MDEIATAAEAAFVSQIEGEEWLLLQRRRPSRPGKAIWRSVISSTVSLTSLVVGVPDDLYSRKTQGGRLRNLSGRCTPRTLSALDISIRIPPVSMQPQQQQI